jgi:hypothetical protein
MGKSGRSARPPPSSHDAPPQLASRAAPITDVADGYPRAPPGDPPNPSQATASNAPSRGFVVGIGGFVGGFASQHGSSMSEFMPSFTALWLAAWLVLAAVLALLILVGLAAAGIATFVVVKRAWSCSSLPGSAVARGVVVANCDVSPSTPLLRVPTAAYVVDAPGSCCAEAPAPAGTQGSNLMAFARHSALAPIWVRTRR